MKILSKKDSFWTSAAILGIVIEHRLCHGHQILGQGQWKHSFQIFHTYLWGSSRYILSLFLNIYGDIGNKSQFKDNFKAWWSFLGVHSVQKLDQGDKIWGQCH